MMKNNTLLCLSLLLAVLLVDLSAKSQCSFTPALKADSTVCPGGSIHLQASCNRGLSFNGTNEYATIDHVAPLIDNTDFTFSCWIKSGQTTGTHSIFSVNSDNGGNRLLFKYNGANGKLHLYDGADNMASTVPVNDNQWHHVAFSYNLASKQASVYLDGSLDTTLTLSGIPASGIQASDLVSLAQEYDGTAKTDLFNGQMDEVRIWDTEITAANIQAWWQQEVNASHPDYSHLIAYYRLTQFAGSNAENDSPVNKNYASLINSPTWVSIDNPHFLPGCTYSWSSVPAGFTGSGTEVVATNITQNTTYTVTITDTNGCSATAEIKAVVPEITSTEFASNSPICENTELAFNDVHAGTSALSFDGANDWLEADALAAGLAASDFTVSMWIKPGSGSGTKFIFSINSATNENRILLGYNYGTGEVVIWDHQNSWNKINDNQWHHIAMSFNNTSKELILYIDGAKQFSTHSESLAMASNDKISFGQEWDATPGDFYEGMMDEIRVWNSIRTQSEIQSWFWRELDAVQYPNLYAYWPLNEGSGSTSSDLSGNGIIATFKNSTTSAQGPQWTSAGWRAYSWTGPNGFSATGAAPSIAHAPLSAEGMYYPTVSVLGCAGMMDSLSVDMDSILVFPTITAVDPVCENAVPFPLAANPTGGAWSGTGIADTATGTFNPATAGTGQTEVVYAYEGANGCLGKDTFKLRVMPAPSLTLTEDFLACGPGNNTQISAACNHVIEMDGNDYYEINSIATDIANSDFSFYAWIKTSQTTGSSSNIMAINTSTGDNRLLFGFTPSSGLLYLFDGATNAVSTTAVNNGQWNHVAFSYDKVTKQAKTYVNGTLESSITLSGLPATGVAATDRISLGQEWDNSSATDFYNGWMEEASFWDTVLTQGQITSYIYKQIDTGHPGYANLVASYNFNATKANAAYDQGPVGHTATLHGALTWAANDIASFTNPCSFSWSSAPPGFTSTQPAPMVAPTVNTTYSVSMTDSMGCSATAQVRTGILDMVPPSLAYNGPICENDTLRFFDLSGGGNALEFDGINDWLEIDAIADDISNSDFTFSCWFKTNSNAANQVLFAANPASGNENLAVLAINAAGTFMLYDGLVQNTLNTATVNDNQWHHVAMTFTLSTKKVEIWIDGFVADTSTLNSIPATGIPTNARISVGQEYDNASLTDFFDGTIDEVRIWNTVLDQNDLLGWIYRQVESGHPKYSNLKGYYQFNGTAGTLVGDDSGNGNDAHKKNSSSTAAGPAYVASTWRTHSWTGPNAFSSALGSPVINGATVAATGHYQVYVEVAGCSSPADSIYANVKPFSLSAAITPPGTYCLSSPADTLEAASGGGVWSGNGITNVNVGIFDPSVAGAGTHQIIYTANDCEVNRDTVDITVLSEASISASGPLSFCQGDSVVLTSSSVTGNTWSTGDTVQSITLFTTGTYSVEVTAGGCLHTDTFDIVAHANPVSSVSGTDITCNGNGDGTATANPFAGTPPYSFAWNDGANQTSQTATSLEAGNYVVTITDSNDCTMNDTVSIAEPTAIVASIASTIDVSCNGGTNGTAKVEASGGVGSFVYGWSNGGTDTLITGLSAGPYSVTVTDSNGCTQTASTTLSEPSPLDIYLDITNISCNGAMDAAIDATPSGGTAPYTYIWSDGALSAGISALAAGSYSVTITDSNGCTIADTAAVVEPAVLTATLTKTDITCNGDANGTATAAPSGGTSPYSYSWSSGGNTASVSGLSSGMHAVTITDANGCGHSDSVSISEPPAITAAVDTMLHVSCHGGNDGSATVMAAGATGPFTFSWPGGETTATVSGLTAGNYMVSVTDTAGCEETVAVSITEPAAISLGSTVVDVSCNGASDGSISSSVAGGTAPFTYGWDNGDITASSGNLSVGVYTLTVTDAKGCTATITETVSGPAALSIGLASNAISCNGAMDGTATATPTGGTSPYTYLWSSGGTTASISSLAAGPYGITVTDANGCTDTGSVSIAEPSPLIAQITASSDVSCFGGNDGSSTVTASGGTAPYSYVWTGGGSAASVSGVQAGIYTVTVTDGHGCTQTATDTIEGPTAIVIALSSTDVLCNGSSDGSATASVSGGTAPYAYLWSTNATTSAITGIPQGNYYITVTDANGCTETGSINVTEPAMISISVNVTNASCNGLSDGGATVTATGGAASYAYLWSNGEIAPVISGVGAGNYGLTVTDANGCSATETIEVSEPAELVVLIDPTNVSCFGASDGAATATVAGGTLPYDFNWSTGAATAMIDGLAGDNYSVVVTDANGCETQADVTISEPSALIATITDSTSIAGDGCSGSATVSVVGGTLPYSYLWNDPMGQTGAVATGLCAGAYCVEVTDSNGCTALDCTEIIALGLDEIADPAEMLLFPNPNQGRFDVIFKGNAQTDGTIEVWDATGRLVKTTVVNKGQNKVTIDLKTAPAGVYTIGYTGNGTYLNERFILE